VLLSLAAINQFIPVVWLPTLAPPNIPEVVVLARVLHGVPTVAILKRRREKSISYDVVSLADSKRPETHRVAVLVAATFVVLRTTQLKLDPSLGAGVLHVRNYYILLM
jgi:hypothetical protein